MLFRIALDSVLARRLVSNNVFAIQAQEETRLTLIILTVMNARITDLILNVLERDCAQGMKDGLRFRTVFLARVLNSINHSPANYVLEIFGIVWW